ncbi:MAG: transposase [Sneathiella sp.]|jgi:transposase
MSGIRYTEEFKRDAVAQVTDRGYSVREIFSRLGLSTKSLYDWKATYQKPAPERQPDVDQALEIQHLKSQLSQVTEEREIIELRKENRLLREEREVLKKATQFFANQKP